MRGVFFFLLVISMILGAAQYFVLGAAPAMPEANIQEVNANRMGDVRPARIAPDPADTAEGT